jgi:TIR domain
MIAEARPDVEPKARIFISYSRKDMAFADRLEAALKARGFETLIDRTEIYAFEDWWKRIEGLIGKADTIVFVLSPDAVASEVALKEVKHAASLNKRFARIVCRRVEDRAIPEALQRLNFIFFDDPARFEASADQLAEAMQTDIGWIRRHTEFGETARRWAATGRPGGLLLRSPVLEEAERWIAARPQDAPAPTAETQAIVAESRRATTRRRNILTASLGFGFVLALALAGIAFWRRAAAIEQRNQALLAQTRFLVNLATHSVTDEDAGTALLLTLEGLPDSRGGIDRPDAPEADAMLFDARSRLRELRIMEGRGGQLWDVEFSMDGQILGSSSRARRKQSEEVQKRNERQPHPPMQCCTSMPRQIETDRPTMQGSSGAGLSCLPDAWRSRWRA